MTNKLKCAIKIIAMTCIVSYSVYWAGMVLRPTTVDSSIATINTFHDMPDDTFEVIGYGSSRIWRGLNPMEMYENYGVGIYNYGCNWQHFNTTYLFFLDSLKTQSPDVVIFEVRNVCNLLTDTTMGGEIYYTTMIDGLDIKTDYLFQVFQYNLDNYISYFSPLYLFHSNWTSLTSSSFDTSFSNDTFYSTMGYAEGKGTTALDPIDYTEFVEYDLKDEGLEILDSIVEICNENNIEIIFYLSPFSGTYKYSDAMSAYALENDCVYFDMFEYMDELGIDWETDFLDNNHLNDSGAEKVSNFLGAYISENYDVTDMRTIEDNIWEQYSN